MGSGTCDRGSSEVVSTSVGDETLRIICASESESSSGSSSGSGPEGRLDGDGHAGAVFVFEQRAFLPGRQLEHGLFALTQTQFTHRPLPLQRQHWGIVKVRVNASE